MWLCPLFLLACITSHATGLSAREWKRRTVYQIITDRFALESGRQDQCDQGPCPYGNYCGGTFQGILDKMDYIKGMGFDAIWISPVVDNFPCGYHGYWARNKFQIEAQFGGADELLKLVKGAQAQGVAVMLDIVANHLGPGGDFPSDYAPFNSSDYFHGTPSNHCQAQGSDQNTLETCWLVNLPDLKQEDPFVSSTLIKWMSGLQQQYGFDGIRIDTVPYVNKQFWKQFKTAALPDTYCVGEVLVDRSSDLNYVSGYQTATGDEGVTGPLLDGVLNYPLFFALRDVFMSNPSSSLSKLHDAWLQLAATFKDENHDQPRWLLGNSDPASYQNGVTAAMFFPGVPIAYYGTEQGMAGGQSDNDKRQPLWSHGGYDVGSPLYIWTAALVRARRAMLKGLGSDDTKIDVVNMLTLAPGNQDVLSFQRGGAVVIMSNKQAGTWQPRRDCGDVGTNPQTCAAAGCCWLPVSPNPGNAPWCYHPPNGPSPPSPPSPSPPSPPAPGGRCATVGANGVLEVDVTHGPRVMMQVGSF
eukprot:gene11305-17960_t